MLDEYIRLKHTSKNNLGLVEFRVGRFTDEEHNHKVIMTNRQPTELKCDCKDCEHRFGYGGQHCKHIIAAAIGHAQDYFKPGYSKWVVFLDGKEAREELMVKEHNGQNVRLWDWKINGFFVLAWEISKETAEAITDVLTSDLWGGQNGFD